MSTLRSHRPRAGFTLIEVLIATVIGVLVLTASTSLALSTWQSLSGTQLRDGIDRNARFIGISLTRDLQETGVDLESKAAFGALAVFGDTVTILRVPYDPTEAQPYPISTANSPVGNCGARCIEIQTGGVAPALSVGDVALFQCLTDRRLIRITALAAVTGGYSVTFANVPTLLRHTGLKPTISNPTATFVQRLGTVVYWRTGTQLMRATTVSTTGVPQGEIAATGVQAFTPTLVFTDGHEASQANGTDADSTNNYDQIAAIRV
ncbi:MAG: prepilin-type N-terminal cleavage/methylation domain-containing protein, partial [Gemmatimonadota bacterium]